MLSEILEENKWNESSSSQHLYSSDMPEMCSVSHFFQVTLNVGLSSMSLFLWFILTFQSALCLVDRCGVFVVVKYRFDLVINHPRDDRVQLTL